MSETDNIPLFIQHLLEGANEGDLLDGFLAVVDAKGLSPCPAKEETTPGIT